MYQSFHRKPFEKYIKSKCQKSKLVWISDTQITIIFQAFHFWDTFLSECVWYPNFCLDLWHFDEMSEIQTWKSLDSDKFGFWISGLQLVCLVLAKDQTWIFTEKPTVRLNFKLDLGILHTYPDNRISDI